MENNEFLLYNKVVFRLHACQSLAELRQALLDQLGTLIPYAYASLIPVARDPDTGDLRHGAPWSAPESFAAAEAQWTGRTDQWYTLWLSRAPEAMVIREREILAEGRFRRPGYESVFRDYAIHDCMQGNITHAGHTLARLALYRTEAEGLFTDAEALCLRALADHIGLAYARCQTQDAHRHTAAEEHARRLAKRFGLTRREEEIVAHLATDAPAAAIAAQLGISRHTLHKHLQNVYRKCGVASREGLNEVE